MPWPSSRLADSLLLSPPKLPKTGAGATPELTGGSELEPKIGAGVSELEDPGPLEFSAAAAPFWSTSGFERLFASIGTGSELELPKFNPPEVPEPAGFRDVKNVGVSGDFDTLGSLAARLASTAEHWLSDTFSSRGRLCDFLGCSDAL